MIPGGTAENVSTIVLDESIAIHIFHQHHEVFVCGYSSCSSAARGRLFVGEAHYFDAFVGCLWIRRNKLWTT